jgi:hypothetical protein
MLLAATETSSPTMRYSVYQYEHILIDEMTPSGFEISTQSDSTKSKKRKARIYL